MYVNNVHELTISLALTFHLKTCEEHVMAHSLGISSSKAHIEPKLWPLEPKIPFEQHYSHLQLVQTWQHLHLPSYQSECHLIHLLKIHI